MSPFRIRSTCGPIAGLVIHRSSRILQTRHPGYAPPRTLIEETVFDLASQQISFDYVVSMLARSCQRHLTTPYLLAMTLEARPKMRWRSEIGFALQDVSNGVHSPLEYRYLRDVERAHGLPASGSPGRGRKARAEGLPRRPLPQIRSGCGT